MLDTISAAVLYGILSASGAAYILTLSDEAQTAATEYVSAAEIRFDEYERWIPGVTDKTPQQ